MKRRSRISLLLCLLAVSAQVVHQLPALGSEVEVMESDDYGPSPFGAAGPQCNIGICVHAKAPFIDNDATPGFADPFKGDPTVDWFDGGTAVNVCCNSSAQKLEILQTADNGVGPEKNRAGDSDGDGSGLDDCRDTPLIDSNQIGCYAGGDVSMGQGFKVLTPGQVYSAVAQVKLIGVNEPEAGMFRARLTIHGYDILGRLQQECNAFLRSTQVNGVPGTEDQTAAFVPIAIPACEMVDSGPSNGGVGNEIRTVDVTVRANAFKNDIAYGSIRVSEVLFVRES